MLKKFKIYAFKKIIYFCKYHFENDVFQSDLLDDI